jgi:hypothetical protein
MGLLNLSLANVAPPLLPNLGDEFIRPQRRVIGLHIYSHQCIAPKLQYSIIPIFNTDF